MVLLRNTLLVCGTLLLPWNAGWATGSTQGQQATPVEPAVASQQSDGEDRTPQSGVAQAGAVPPSPPYAAPPAPIPGAPPAPIPGTPPAPVPGAPAAPIPGAPPAPIPGVPPAPIPGAPPAPIPGAPPPAGLPVPATTAPAPAANPSLRFNMQENGANRTADEFDAWLEAQGVRVATGKPAIPLVQTCPTPEGDRGDNDADGIINCLDQCPTSIAGQAIGLDGCPAQISIDLKGVTFAYDKATLDASAKAVLDEAAQILQRHEALKVEVAGHTDSRGDAAYNQRLSERRARAVYDYLVEQGVDAARLIGPIGFGETRPLMPNEKPDGSDDPEARSRNRRTELNIQN